MNIAKIVTLPESKILEFKRDISPLKQIMKTIVAFANTAGGVIVIGRGDNGEIDIVSLEGKSLLCVRVAHWPGPFYLKSEGEAHGVYIRLGSSTRQSGPEFIAEIKRQRENKSFDQLPCPDYDIEALDYQFIQKEFGKMGRKIKEQQLVSLGLLTPFAGRNVVTYGGLIRIKDFCQANGYPIPEWQEIGPVLRVILHPHPEVEESAPPVIPQSGKF